MLFSYLFHSIDVELLIAAVNIYLQMSISLQEEMKLVNYVLCTCYFIVTFVPSINMRKYSISTFMIKHFIK